MIGTYALSAGYYDAFYGQAQKVRTIIGDEHAAAFERLRRAAQRDLADGRVPLGEKAENPLAMYLSDVLTIPSEHGRAARALDPVRALRRAAGGAPAPRPAVLREPPLRASATRWRRRIGFDFVPERLR